MLQPFKGYPLLKSTPMTKKPLLSLMAVALLFTSCVNFYFAEPIPKDIKDAKVLPNLIEGTWISDDATHTFDKHTWIRKTTDTLGYVTTDTIFALSNHFLVKEWDGYYFFNVKEDNGYWSVFMGHKKDEHFLIRGLTRLDIDIIGSTLNMHPDSTARDMKEEYYYNTSFTTKQLKKILKKGAFTDTLLNFNLQVRTLQ